MSTHNNMEGRQAEELPGRIPPGYVLAPAVFILPSKPTSSLPCSFRKASPIVAGLLSAAGFLLAIYALHFGVNPYAVKR